MRRTLPSLVLLVSIAAASPSLAAENDGVPEAYRQPVMTPIEAPAQKGAIPLYKGAAPGSEGDAREEIWFEINGDQVARNVVKPTLTPYLPDPKKATGAAVVVTPGGGFMVLSMKNEGFDVAQWLADRGIAAFLLKYRLKETPLDNEAFSKQMSAMMSMPRTAASAAERPRPPVFSFAIDDAQEALRMIRRRADEWGVDRNRIGMVGFSAGAMTVLQTALRNAPDAKPNFIGVIYGPLLEVEAPENAPPMFNAIAADDPLIRATDGSFKILESWRKVGSPVEFHYYQSGGHGFGMSPKGLTSDAWIDQFHLWIKVNGFLAGKN